MCGEFLSRLSAPSAVPRSIAAISARMRDHGVAESVELALRFALGRLDHQRLWHRPGHGRGVEAVVDQPLGHILDGDTGRLLDRPQVDDALVRDHAVLAGVDDRKMRREPTGDVVGVEDRHLRSRAAARQRPSSRYRPRRSAGSRASPTVRQKPAPMVPSAAAAGLTPRTTACPGRKGARCCLTPIGPIPGPPPPCGMQKVLCRLRWRDVGADLGRPAEPDQRVEVGAVQIDLAAGSWTTAQMSRIASSKTPWVEG